VFRSFPRHNKSQSHNVTFVLILVYRKQKPN